MLYMYTLKDSFKSLSVCLNRRKQETEIGKSTIKKEIKKKNVLKKGAASKSE